MRSAYPLKNRLRLELPFRLIQMRQPIAESVSVPFTLSRLGNEISVSVFSVLQALLFVECLSTFPSNF